MVERARAFAKITQKTGCLLALRDSLQCQSLLLREFCGTSTKGFGGFFERGAAVLRVQTLTAVGEDQRCASKPVVRSKHLSFMQVLFLRSLWSGLDRGLDVTCCEVQDGLVDQLDGVRLGETKDAIQFHANRMHFLMPNTFWRAMHILFLRKLENQYGRIQISNSAHFEVLLL